MALCFLANLADLKLGGLSHASCNGVSLCVARLSNGNVHVVADECSHEQYSLSEGALIDNEIECPQHAARFDPLTGEPTSLPAEEPVQTYQVQIEDGRVFVDI
jgi:3-phenylpropionate/trans-cinnamate dioxygenase ferredoxin subunit